MSQPVYSRSNPPPKNKLGPFTDGLTKQSFADECDINKIVKKALRNGMLPEGNLNPIYGDFAAVKDYQEGLNTILRADAQFASLPAHVRSKFQNDPAQFLEFANNPANGKEMVELGLAVQRNSPPEDLIERAKTPSLDAPVPPKNG